MRPDFKYLTALILVMSVCSAFEVKEKTSSCSCCGSARIEFDPTCEHFWSRNDMTFAYTKDDTRKCVSPCKQFDGVWIVLDSCLPVNVTIICSTAKNGPEETIIRYLCNQCQSSGGKPGSRCCVGLQVLTLIIGQLLMWMLH